MQKCVMHNLFSGSLYMSSPSREESCLEPALACGYAKPPIWSRVPVKIAYKIAGEQTGGRASCKWCFFCPSSATDAMVVTRAFLRWLNSEGRAYCFTFVSLQRDRRSVLPRCIFWNLQDIRRMGDIEGAGTKTIKERCCLTIWSAFLSCTVTTVRVRF